MHKNLENCNIDNQVGDSLKWSYSSIYTVNSRLHLSFNKMMVNLWHWKLVWKTKLPPKISRFIWTALKGACLTQDNLIRGNFQLVNRMPQWMPLMVFHSKKKSCVTWKICISPEISSSIVESIVFLKPGRT